MILKLASLLAGAALACALAFPASAAQRTGACGDKFLAPAASSFAAAIADDGTMISPANATGPAAGWGAASLPVALPSVAAISGHPWTICGSSENNRAVIFNAPLLAAPAAPVLSQTAGGSLPARTYYVSVTFTNIVGETVGSTEATLAVGVNSRLVVASPASSGNATGWNVYVGTATGNKTKQNSGPLVLGSNFTEPLGGLIAGTALPGTNTAPSAYILDGGRVLLSYLIGGSNYQAATLSSDGSNYRVISASDETRLHNGAGTGFPARIIFPGGPGYQTTQADNGYVITSGASAAGLTVTLPSTTTIAAGWTVRLSRDGGRDMTVQTNATSGGSIVFPGGSQSLMKLAAFNYEFIELQYDGAVFRIIAASPGTAALIGMAGTSGLGGTIMAFGAVCNGTTDDGAAINAALASGFKTIYGPDVGVCRSSEPIIVPGGSTLMGRNAASMGTNAESGPNVPGGFTIKCDLTVQPCIRLDGNNNQSALINVGVDRAAGTIPGGSIGVELHGGMYTVVENVGIYRQAVGIYLFDMDTYLGLSAFLNRVLTCGITESHIKISGWRETRINQSRFGCGGALDVANNEYIHIRGGHGDGPNTVYVVNSQFNHGSGAIADCFVRWASMGGGQDGPTAGWVFDGVHVEQARHAFCSDYTLTNLNGLQVANSKLYGGFVPNATFFNLNSATIPNSMNLTGNQIIAWGDITLQPNGQMSGITMTGNEFITTDEGIRLTGVAGSAASLSGNRWTNMTIAGDWGGLTVSGVGGLTNNATGYVNIDVPGYGVFICANMRLRFGGLETGITYKSPAPICNWRREGNVVTVGFYIELLNKGSATGMASLSGLPYTASFAPGIGTAVMTAANMADIGGPVYASTGAASNLINLYKPFANDRGIIQLTDANFTNTSIVQGLITYAPDAGPLPLPAP